MNSLTVNLVTNSRDYVIPCQTTQGPFSPIQRTKLKNSVIYKDFLAAVLTFSENINMWSSIKLQDLPSTPD